MPGETVIAVGNAYGYTHTVTRGIISALHRNVQVSDVQSYEDLIQTDASINPGNSGGPLLNVDGEMVGINVAVRAGAQGIGFAIPVNQAIAVAADLLATEWSKNGSVGIEIEERTSPEGGVCVKRIDRDGPAKESGLLPEDELVAVDGISVKRSLDFHRALLEKRSGEEVCLEVRRDGRIFSKQIELAKAKQRFHRWNKAWEVLGVSLRPVPVEEFQRRFNTVYRGGLMIEDVRKDSPADGRGLQKGDILVGLHVWETVTLDNVDYILNHSDIKGLDPLKVYILRQGNTLYSYLPISQTGTELR
jgi:serine protease Do